jgi:hypothetical protein
LLIINILDVYISFAILGDMYSAKHGAFFGEQNFVMNLTTPQSAKARPNNSAIDKIP